MAQRVQVLLTCDLHGDDTSGDTTIDFALDGTSYEIDVCDQHGRQLRDSFADYVGAARRAGSGGGRAGGRRSGRGRAGSGGGRRRTAEVREWARANGLAVSERGRIPAKVMEQYEAANA
jgi:hypothetical protein